MGLLKRLLPMDVRTFAELVVSEATELSVLGYAGSFTDLISTAFNRLLSHARPDLIERIWMWSEADLMPYWLDREYRPGDRPAGEELRVKDLERQAVLEYVLMNADYYAMMDAQVSGQQDMLFRITPHAVRLLDMNRVSL